MNSTAHMSDNNFKKSGLDKKENKVRGLFTIYSMNSTAHMSRIITSKNQVWTKRKIRLKDVR